MTAARTGVQEDRVGHRPEHLLDEPGLDLASHLAQGFDDLEVRGLEEHFELSEHLSTALVVHAGMRELLDCGVQRPDGLFETRCHVVPPNCVE